ncbi:SMP-30/gluconolactonase/LRE family protein [Rhodococcus marinonascens]|uniref:SMP-30/gluconolactonase/LRE family protein n=1 Tax=Rhodococcus marinonascens TaxID=38311 RepID=UPI0009345468|nr:SMP-30/gluconolactonase/LRE family protein [Rhodococcus marinonascens]
MRVSTFADFDARVGEGPVWDNRTGVLHWVDIPRGRVHATDFETRQTQTLTVGTTVGAVAPRSTTSGYIAAIGEGFGVVSSERGLEVTNAILPSGVRMNDAKCDARGRLWAGSCALDFASGGGALHVLDADFTARTVLDGWTLPNGLGWSPESDLFYLVDSLERSISIWDYDLESARLSDHRILTTFSSDEGLPDGLCVDTNGCIWVAMWGGGRVVQLSPQGHMLTSIELPVQQPSSCAFGGAQRDILIVTSAREDLARAAPIDGSILALHDTGSRGTEVAFFSG